MQITVISLYPLLGTIALWIAVQIFKKIKITKSIPTLIKDILPAIGLYAIWAFVQESWDNVADDRRKIASDIESLKIPERAEAVSVSLANLGSSISPSSGASEPGSAAGLWFFGIFIAILLAIYLYRKFASRNKSSFPYNPSKISSSINTPKSLDAGSRANGGVTRL